MAEETPTSMPAVTQPDPEPIAQPLQQQEGEQPGPPAIPPLPSAPINQQPDTEMTEAAVRLCICSVTT